MTSPRNEQPERAMVPLTSIRPADSPRLTGESEDNVKRLAELESETPPIIVHRQTMRVVDGMHRLRAAELKGQERVLVEFFDGTEDDAFKYSVEINTRHGLPLTLADRKAAALRITGSHPDLSDRAIASCAGLSPKTVAAMRSSASIPKIDNRRGTDGRVRPIDIVEGRLRARDIIEQQPEASLREVARQAGVSPTTAKDVRDRINRGDSPVPLHTTRASEKAATVNEVSIRSKITTRLCDTHVRDDLARLRQDPAVRQSESGRNLLRWLARHAADLDQWRDLINGLPPHRNELFVRIARQCAEEWQSAAVDLESRLDR